MAAPYGPPPGQYAPPAPPPGMGFGGGPPPGGGSPLSHIGTENAQSLKTWLKFVGIVSIVGGGLYCLTIVGIIVGWLPILLGYWQYKASENLERYINSGDQNSLEEMIGSLRLHYLTSGILIIVGLCLTLLMFITYLIVGAAMLASFR